MLARWYGLDSKYGENAKDFARLLGIGMLAHAAFAALIPISVKDMDTKLAFTWVYLFNGCATFGYRCFMYFSERFHGDREYGYQPTVPLLVTMCIDLSLTLAYARCIQYYRDMERMEAAVIAATAATAAADAVSKAESAASVAVAKEKGTTRKRK